MRLVNFKLSKRLLLARFESHCVLLYHGTH